MNINENQCVLVCAVFPKKQKKNLLRFAKCILHVLICESVRNAPLLVVWWLSVSLPLHCMCLDMLLLCVCICQTNVLCCVCCVLLYVLCCATSRDLPKAGQKKDPRGLSNIS